MDEPLDTYDQICLSIGRMSRCWGLLDYELNLLLGEMLQIDEERTSCITTELRDVAPKCRTIRALSFAVGAPQDWIATLTELLNIIQNQLGPSRNRIIHDAWYETPEQGPLRLDKRAKVTRPQSFTDFTLSTNREHSFSVDDVDLLAIRIIAAMPRVAQARFDIEKLNCEGSFPERPELDHARIKQIPELQLPPDA
ncbi:MAG: hypothetical protein ABGW84_12245 [Sphingomonadaceae bacterium]